MSTYSSEAERPPWETPTPAGAVNGASTTVIEIMDRNFNARDAVDTQLARPPADTSQDLRLAKLRTAGPEGDKLRLLALSAIDALVVLARHTETLPDAYLTFEKALGLFALPAPKGVAPPKPGCLSEDQLTALRKVRAKFNLRQRTEQWEAFHKRLVKAFDVHKMADLPADRFDEVLLTAARIGGEVKAGL